MLTDVMAHYGLARDLRRAGYFATDHHQQIAREIQAAILAGQLVAVTGVVGSGKTVMLRRFQDHLAQEGKVIVSRSLSVEKSRATLQTLITALFYDLSNDEAVKIPPRGEERERELQQLIRRKRKPIALFVDEAHDLPVKTLVELKRLMEVAAEVAGVLSIVLIGHPKLHNALRRSTMEEIGSRTAVLPFDGLAGQQADYIRWLLVTCAVEGTAVDSLITDPAVALLAERLLTPLQIEQHLILAFEEGFRVGERPVTAEVIENILARDLNDLEPQLTRHGYSVRALAEQFSAKPAEIRQLFRGDLNAARTQELSERMRKAGLPI
jgi:type II secretory pathway predicted ATPase ExeA